MPRVMTSRTLRSPDVQVFRAKFTDTMKAVAGDIALDTAGYKFHLFTLPPNCIVTGGTIEILTASNATGATSIVIGTSADPDAYLEAFDAKTVALDAIGGAALNKFAAAATPVYMTVSGTTAAGSVGEFVVTLQFIQTDSACRVSAIGVDNTKYDAMTV